METAFFVFAEDGLHAREKKMTFCDKNECKCMFVVERCP